MFVVSVKTSKKQLISLLICLLLLIAVVLLSIFHPAAKATAAPLPDDTARMAYLRALGYEAAAGVQVEEILLPAEADEVLQTYNALQQDAGMDLTPYLGKRVKCWTYTVTNLPEGDAVAHLYTYRDTLVAGDITSRDGTRTAALVPVGKDEDPYARKTG